MKRNSLIILFLISVIMFTSCSFETYIPEKSASKDSFSEYEGLFRQASDELKSYGKEVLISDTSVYRHELCKDISGLYMVDFESNSASHIQNQTFSGLINQCKVKMIDTATLNGIFIATFGFSTPNHDFDWGYYYTDNDTPMYFGNPDAVLSENGNGFSYEYKASAMTTVTFYTEKIIDYFYYYEIK